MIKNIIVKILFMIPFYCYTQHKLCLKIITHVLKGDYYIALYDSPKTHMETPIIKRMLTKKSIQKLTCFNLKKSGLYSISIYNDINKNKKLDTTIFGIPLEPYAFSNNVKSFLGYPSFRSSCFFLKKYKLIIINI